MERQHFLANLAFGAGLVMRQTGFQRDAKNNGDNRNLMSARHSEQWPSRAKLQIGGVNHRQSLLLQSQPRDVMQQTEGFGVDRLIAFVIADYRSAAVGGNDFGRLKVASGKSGFARAGRADQQNQRWVWNFDSHGYAETYSLRSRQVVYWPATALLLNSADCNCFSASSAFSPSLGGLKPG